MILQGEYCPNCQSEEFDCYVAFIGPTLIYLYYCESCKFNHMIPRII